MSAATPAAEPPRDAPRDPLLRYTREGIALGLQARAHSDYSWITKGMGFVVGGAGGWAATERILLKFAKQSTARSMTQVPILVFASVTSAFMGKELAQPCATFGMKLGRTATLGLEGLQYDLLGPPADGRDVWTRARSSSAAAQVLQSQEEFQDLLQASATEVREARQVVQALKQAGGEEASEAVSEAEERAAAALERGKAVAELAQQLGLERTQERSIRYSRRSATSSGERRQLDRALDAVAGRKAALKQEARARFNVNLSSALQGELTARVSQLRSLRREEAKLKARLLRDPEAAAASKDEIKADLHDLRRAKKLLKTQTSADYDMKLGRLARGVRS